MKSFNKHIPDWFILAIFAMIFLAWLVPGIGMRSAPLNLSLVIDIGITLIFFFYGLKLNFSQIKQGMSNWRMHIAIQVITFVIFPLLVLPFYPLFKGTDYGMYWLGVFFMAALPSTVSSSVVMVSIARGNVPGAIFNASISGILGIAMTPFWIGLVLNTQQGGFNFSRIIIQLIWQIIIPVAAGLLLNRYFYKWASRSMKVLGNFDKIIILLVVYESFSNSFMSGIFAAVSWLTLTVLVAAVVALFFMALSITGIMAKKMHFSIEDKITLQFSGSKKSLVHGSVFYNVIFPGATGSGVYLLPIMIYHAFQLFFVSVLAQKYQKRDT